MNSSLKFAIETVLRMDSTVIEKLPSAEKLLCEKIRAFQNKKHD